jgi:hypothetical protein
MHNAAGDGVAQAPLRQDDAYRAVVSDPPACSSTSRTACD